MRIPKYIMISLCLFTNTYLFSQEQEIPEAVAYANRSIYKLGVNSGTGFLLENGLLVTALHIFLSHTYGVPSIKDNLDSISLSQNDVPANIKIKSLKAVSAYADIAVFEVEGDFHSYLLEGKTSSLEEEFFLAGYPSERSFIHYTKSRNVFKQLSDFHLTMSFDSTDLNGMSGSPLLNSQGQFVGLMVSGEGNVHNTVMSSKINDVVQGRIGTRCEGNMKACIEQEVRKLQKQVDVQLNSNYEMKETDHNLFHHPLAILWSILQRKQIEPYLKQGSRLGFVNASVQLAQYYHSDENLKEVTVNKSGTVIVRSKAPSETAYQTNVERFEEELKKAADQGYYFAQLALGLFYERQFHSLKNDFQKKNPDQPFNKDPVIHQMWDQAVYYLRLAADQDYATASYGLFQIYYIVGDREKWLEWLIKAGDQGNIMALYRLGTMYLNGENGVQQNFEQAYYYALQLERQGRNIRQFIEKLKKEAEDEKNASAQYVLGLHYIGSADKIEPLSRESFNRTAALRRRGVKMITTASQQGESRSLNWIKENRNLCRTSMSFLDL